MRLAILLALAVAGCSDPMFSGRSAHEGAAAISQKLGGDLQVTRVSVQPEAVKLNVQVPGKPGSLEHWWFYQGKVGGPKPVIVSGSGALPLFRLDDVDLRKIPEMVTAAAKATNDRIIEADLHVDIIHPDTPPSWMFTGKRGGLAFCERDGSRMWVDKKLK